MNVKDCPLLQNLTCAENRLKVLELPAEASLTNLNCNCNELKELDLKSITLLKLECKNNQLKRLNLQCPSLLYINCSNNNLRILDLSDCPSILAADRQGNPLQNILR